jgi:hypothetical protein
MLIFTPDHWGLLSEELQSLDDLTTLLARAEALVLRRYRQKGEIQLAGYPDDPALMSALRETIADVAAHMHSHDPSVSQVRVGQRTTTFRARELPAALFARLDCYSTRVAFHFGL